MSVARFSEADIRSPYGSDSLRFAFADPPYPGQSQRLYGKHEDFKGEVDHTALIDGMAEYDGWALCTSSTALRFLLPLCPEGTRVLAWVKPMTPYKPGVSLSYGWEPVLLYGGRRRHRTAPIVRDWIECNPAAWRGQNDTVHDRASVIGMKPPALCRWVFDCLGARPDDVMDDLFPGSGAVTAAWKAYCAQPGLHDQHAPPADQMELDAA